MSRLLRAALPLLCLFAVPVAAQKFPAVGIIDVYGLRTVSELEVRKALGFAAGDDLPRDRKEVEKRLAKIKGVERASLIAVCCDARKSIVFVGIEEASTPALTFNPAPLGPARLAPEIVANGEALERARESAIRRGDPGEDVSFGHSLMRDPAARALQFKEAGFAKRDLPQLREVLKTSANAEHRALAAEVLGYAPDKKVVIPDLMYAMRDPAPNVRNNAVRSLSLIALLGQSSPQLGITVPPAPFVDLLSSPVWTDRNKATMALVQLTQSRDSALIRSLRDRALPSLVEMSRWKSAGHAQMPFMILGRVAGLPDDSIFAAWSRGDRDAVIRAATPR